MLLLGDKRQGKTKMTSDILNPKRFTTQIAKHSDYLKNLPQQDIDIMPQAELRNQRGRAIQLGSYALANERIEKHGEYDLDANLFTLVATTENFLKSYQSMEAFKDERHESNFSHNSASSIDKYHDDKNKVIAFNHALKEVINAGAAKFNFSELLTFMTNMHVAINGGSEQVAFHDVARRHLVGMRNEIAFEQILIAAGIEYEAGSIEDDAEGGDFIINGVPIDVKASESTARQAQEKKYRNGYDASHIMWSQIDFEDFNGALVLPQDVVTKKVPTVHTLVNIATQSKTQPRVQRSKIS